jgi:Skp family chaperone for outer membrane proteins
MSDAPLNDLVVKVRAAHPGAYDDMDDATLTKRVLAKYPQYSDLAAPKVPRPSLPSGLQPTIPDFSDRIGLRLEQNLWHGPAQLLDEAMKGVDEAMKGTTPRVSKGPSKILYPWGTGPIGRFAGPLTVGPRVVYQQGKGMIEDWTKDPANLPADLLTAYILGNLGEGETGTKAPKVTAATKSRLLAKLPPEEQAKYSAVIDKVNESHAKKLADYHEKVTKTFDEAKQSQIEGEAKHASDVAKVEAENAEKQAKYEQKVAAVTRRGTLSGYQERYAKVVKDMVDRTHNNVRKWLDSRWEALREKNKMERLDSQRIKYGFDAARAILAGQPEDLKLFNQIIDEVSSKTDIVDNQPRLRPMSWEEGRVSYTNLGDKKYASSGLLRKAYGMAQDVVGQQLNDAANRAGTGREYQLLKNDWSQYMEDWNDMSSVVTGGGSPLARLRRMVDLPYVADAVNGKAADRLMETIDRYKRFGGNRQTMEGLRRIAKQAEELPKKKPETPSLKATPEATREIPTKELPKPPQLKKVPPPTVKIHRPSSLARTVGRLTGKIAGGALGTKVGHPLIGYGIGGEIGGNLAERLEAIRKQLPPVEPLPPP